MSWQYLLIIFLLIVIFLMAEIIKRQQKNIEFERGLHDRHCKIDYCTVGKYEKTQ